MAVNSRFESASFRRSASRASRSGVFASMKTTSRNGWVTSSVMAWLLLSSGEFIGAGQPVDARSNRSLSDSVAKLRRASSASASALSPALKSSTSCVLERSRSLPDADINNSGSSCSSLSRAGKAGTPGGVDFAGDIRRLNFIGLQQHARRMAKTDC